MNEVYEVEDEKENQVNHIYCVVYYIMVRLQRTYYRIDTIEDDSFEKKMSTHNVHSFVNSLPISGGKCGISYNKVNIIYPFKSQTTLLTSEFGFEISLFFNKN